MTHVIESAGPYVVVANFKKDETGMYHILNSDTGVVEMETSILPQAITYMRSVARSLDAVLRDKSLDADEYDTSSVAH